LKLSRHAVVGRAAWVKVYAPVALNGRRGEGRRIFSAEEMEDGRFDASTCASTHIDRSVDAPTNLTQAQRDFFGAHTYERIDEKGTFHTKWEE